MQAIVVKFFGPTTKGPARVQAKNQAKTRFYTRGLIENELTARGKEHSRDNMTRIAAEFLGFETGHITEGYELIEGGLPNGDSVFVLRKIDDQKGED